MNTLLLTSLLFFSPTDPSSTEGCTKDTDCKGDRICDAETSRCVPPTPPTVEGPSVEESFQSIMEVEGAPLVAEPPPPTAPKKMVYSPRYQMVKVHPYTSGGAGMIVFGVIATGVGAGILGYHTQRIQNWSSTGDLGEFQDLVERTPKVHVGSGILISSGVTLLIGGIVLSSITEEVRQRVSLTNGITFSF